VLGDRGYDAESIWQGLRARCIKPMLAKRNTEHGTGLGRWRWVVERTFAWLNQFRRLRVRYEKRADIHEAFLALACASSAGTLSKGMAQGQWVGSELEVADRRAEVIQSISALGHDFVHSTGQLLFLPTLLRQKSDNHEAGGCGAEQPFRWTPDYAASAPDSMSRAPN
jgi:hypothetical protein